MKLDFNTITDFSSIKLVSFECSAPRYLENTTLFASLAVWCKGYPSHPYTEERIGLINLNSGEIEYVGGGSSLKVEGDYEDFLRYLLNIRIENLNPISLYKVVKVLSDPPVESNNRGFFNSTFINKTVEFFNKKYAYNFDPEVIEYKNLK